MKSSSTTDSQRQLSMNFSVANHPMMSNVSQSNGSRSVVTHGTVFDFSSWKKFVQPNYTSAEHLESPFATAKMLCSSTTLRPTQRGGAELISEVEI
jgi:hypothetical protein